MGDRLGFIVLTYGLKPGRPFAGFLLASYDEAAQMAETAKTGPGERHVIAEVIGPDEESGDARTLPARNEHNPGTEH
jgi:hypothetical protein